MTGDEAGAKGRREAVRRARRPSTAAGDIVKAVIDIVADVLDADALCRSAGIERADLAREGTRVHETTVLQLWTEVERRTGDPYIGLHIAERGAESGAWGLLAYAVKACASVEDAWARVRRYMPLVFTGADEVIDAVGPHGERTIGYRRLPGGNPLVPPSEDCAIASFVLACRAAVGPSFRPMRALFQRAAPPDHAEYVRVLGCPVEFEAELNGVVLDEVLFKAPLRTSDPHLLALLEQMAERRLAEMTDDANLGDLVSRWIELRIDAGETPTIADAARAFHRSVRSLQRELADIERPFRALVDDARRDIAVRRIAAGEKTAKEVAAEVGFADTTQFYRAFQRWTGQTVAEFRKGSGRRDPDEPGA